MTNSEFKNKLKLIITWLTQLSEELDEKCTEEPSVIDRLKVGEELELSDKQIDEVLDYLEENEDSYSIKIINNKVTLKL